MAEDGAIRDVLQNHLSQLFAHLDGAVEIAGVSDSTENTVGIHRCFKTRADSAPTPPRASMPRPSQPWPIRLTHWANVPLIVIMAGSGLQILAAYPMLGPRGALYHWYPFNGDVPPSWLTIGGWLAGARHWHFAFAWLFVINGLAYWAYLVITREWHRRFFLPWRDTRNALQTVAYYARIRKTPPPQSLYNGLQRLAYTTASLLALVVVWSGVAIYKPVQLHAFTVPFGGYDGARAVHLVTLALLALFTVGHVVMVLLHPRSLADMIAGGKSRG